MTDEQRILKNIELQTRLIEKSINKKKNDKTRKRLK